MFHIASFQSIFNYLRRDDMRRISVIALVFLSLNLSQAFGQVDSQWRGPNRDGIYPNEKLLKEWPDNGPKLLWSATGIGEGFSSAAVTSDRVYTTGMKSGTGYLSAMDMNGKLIWKTSYGPEWDGSRPGARTTPTVVGDKIYVESAKGQVVCIGTNGKEVWSVDLIKDYNARNIEWGMTESLLVDGDRVFCTPGGSDAMVVALNRHSGELIWKTAGNRETSAYCSPCLVSHGKLRLILTMTAKSFVGLKADNGEYLWHASHVTDYDVNPNTPLYHNGFVYTVSGYGTGGQKFELLDYGKSIDLVWKSNKLDSQMGAVILIDGYIYGSGHNNRGWHCLDWKSGEVQYSERVLGNKGNIIYSDGMLYCYSERGDVALVEPNPQQFEVISSFTIEQGEGPHWAHPVIKDGRLYIRHGDVLMVYDISR